MCFDNPPCFQNLTGSRQNKILYLHLPVLFWKWFRNVSKVFKNIAVFSLWLAGLVIMAHLMIPHDHHSDCSEFSKENQCHADNTKTPVKAPVFPIHCHALNDLTFDKTSVTFVIFNNFPSSDLFLFSFFETSIANSEVCRISRKNLRSPLILAKYLRLSPFRAPPTLI